MQLVEIFFLQFKITGFFLLHHFLGEDNRNFRASLFVDIGNVFEDIADFSYSDLRGSYGIQGNFRTPVGAVSIGFVDAFKSKTGDDTKPIIFSLGGAF